MESCGVWIAYSAFDWEPFEAVLPEKDVRGAEHHGFILGGLQISVRQLIKGSYGVADLLRNAFLLWRAFKPGGKMKKILFIAITSVLWGCASGITSVQKDEYQSYKAKGYAVEEKNQGTAAALGILPGGGSFYTRNYGFGVVNLLLWPASILWDPVSGVNGAESLNYHATMANVEKMRQKELHALDEQLALGNVDQKTYIVQKNEISQKYEP